LQHLIVVLEYCYDDFMLDLALDLVDDLRNPYQPRMGFQVYLNTEMIGRVAVIEGAVESHPSTVCASGVDCSID